MEILLAEDNPGDVRLTREAFKKAEVNVNLSVASNGEVAMAMLRREGKYADAARPDLILLDLNMPRKDGRSVLRELKSDPALDCIPVIVFTSSHAEQDVVRSYKLHASCYIPKPEDASQFNDIVRGIEKFWFNIARLPKDCHFTNGRP
jgi:two-component system, chemotaxis family, response regulator Rcp1